MAALILPSRWTQQPQGPVELLSEYRQSARYVLIGGQRNNLVKPSIEVTKVAPHAGLHGVAWKTASGSGNGGVLGGSEDVFSTGSTMTLLLVGPKMLTNGGHGFTGVNVSGANIGAAQVYLPFVDGNLYFRWGGSTEGVTQLTVSSLAYSDRDIFALTVGSRGMEVWQNGRLVASNSATPSRTAAAVNALLGDFVDGTSDEVTVSLYATFDAQFSRNDLHELTQNPWQIFRPRVRRIYFDLGAGGTPTISPSGIVSAEAFGGATITRTSVKTVSATGISSAEAFGTATASRTSVQSVTASGIASSEAFGTATLSRTSVKTITCTGIVSAEAFGTATVTRSSVKAVAPTGIASAEAFGTHTITPGGVVVPVGIPSAEAFGTATLTRTSVQSVSATGTASGEAFGSAVVTRASAQSIVVSGIASGEAFGSATFTRIGQGVVAPQGIASAEAFGTTTLTRTSLKTITTTGIASSEAFGALVVSIPGERTLTAQDLADIADAVWAHPKALTIARFLGLK